MLEYLDSQPQWHCVLATANCNLDGLTARFQTRFQQFKLGAPSSEEVAALLSKFPLDTHAQRIAQGCKGNVRAALLDAQSVVDCQTIL